MLLENNFGKNASHLLDYNLIQSLKVTGIHHTFGIYCT